MTTTETNPQAALQQRLDEIRAQIDAIITEKAETNATYRVKLDALEVEFKRTAKSIRVLGGEGERTSKFRDAARGR